MIPLNCLIVDDEPIACDIIQTYCNHLSYLRVVASCGNALDARLVLQQQKVHILFLDINMPVIDGLSFLKTLRNPPQVIFTTAYKEFALNAFDLAACDYLLKPFSLDRFMIAVDKAREKIGQPAPVEETPAARADTYLFIKSDGKIFKVDYDDILFAEARGNNTLITTVQATLMPAIGFTRFEELLPRNQFIRVHRSFIINKSGIGHIEGNRVFIRNTEIPIGSNYKEGFLKELGFSS